jgi:TolB-like protein/Tfp pilus assembly protein PilF
MLSNNSGHRGQLLSFFNELKRRNVFKVTIAYVVMAWLVMQVADVILNNVEAPDWVFHVILLLLGIGLLFAIFFAWAFELTPEGIKKEKDIDRTQSITHVTGRKLDFIIIGIMAVALGYFAYDKLVLSASREAALVEATTQAAVEQAAIDEVAVESDKSIAVLPFVNMSDDPGNEYFSDGISEELLNLLSKISEMRVISRSSAFSFKGKDIDIPTIAEQLNVAYVLEGSVRKAGNQVRITAQLIEARSDTHMWSETYDRTLDDIFAIQDEIAAEVVAQLKVTLLGDAPKVEETDLAAYALYLQARHLGTRITAESLEQSKALYQQALAIDPGYAAAWSGLAGIYITQGLWSLQHPDKAYTLAREATKRALSIDPNHALAHSHLGMLALIYDRNLEVAARHLRHALALEPGNIGVLSRAASLAQDLGRLDVAIAVGEYVVDRDPINPTLHESLGWSYLCAKRLDEAIASFRTALTLNPGHIASRYRIGVALLLKGEPLAALEEMQQEQKAAKRLEGEAVVYHALGQSVASDAALAELIDKYERRSAYNIAYVLAFLGEADRAFAWLDKAVQYNDTGLPQIASQPEFTNIHDDPRWLPFLESIGMSPEQLDAIEFKITLPE